MTNPVNRITQRTAALGRLDEALARPKDSFIRDSAIQRFEFTADVAWKVLQSVLEEKFGIRANSPKTAVRLAGENGLVADVPAWLALIDDRNLTSHSYDEAIADQIYNALPHYAALVRTLLEAVQSETKE